jgi:hypothetical protein
MEDGAESCDWLREEAWEEAIDYNNRYAAAGLWQLAKTHGHEKKKPGRGGSGIFRGTLGFRFAWPPPHPLPPAGAAVGKLATVVSRLLHMERVLYGLLGRAVQVDPIKPASKAPGIKLL